MKEYSLVSIINNNADLSEALARKIEQVKNDKQSLMEAAKEVEDANKEEIMEGTRKKSLLLTEGKERGLTEDEIMKEHGKFIPTVYTPILNLLYYILKDSKEDTKRIQKFCHELNMQKGSISGDLYNVEDVSQLVEQYNKNYGHLQDNDKMSKDTIETPEMEKYLFENCTYDVFCKIKKLKHLMSSSHEGESLSAYKKCRELCDKHNLDFEKIK